MDASHFEVQVRGELEKKMDPPGRRHQSAQGCVNSSRVWASWISRFSQIERRLRQWQREDSASQRIAAIPGVGLLSATAAVATMGDARAFGSGRKFAAWLGLVVTHSSSQFTLALR